MRQSILGHRGMVGSAIHRLIPDAEVVHGPIDLRGPGLMKTGVDVLYLCAARVGGIQRNINEPGRMIYDNLMIQTNVIEAALKAGVKLIVFLGSSCIYPRDWTNPISGQAEAIPEEALLGSWLEPTNEPYAIAKIAGIKMLEAYHKQYGMEYLAVMPCNLYGPGDNYDPETSHFLPAMIRKFHYAKRVKGPTSVKLWGTGRPRRELMHVDDCARIITELVQRGARGLINIGPGYDDTIESIAHHVRVVVDASRIPIEWDTSKPDGVMRKLLDVSRMKSFGVGPRIGLGEGIFRTYADYVAQLRTDVVGSNT